MIGLVLEGIVGSGKTSVIRHLKKYFLEKDCSVLILTEHYTERPMEPLPAASSVKSVSHLNQITNVVKTLHEMENETPSGLRSDAYFVFERFHLSHCLDISGFEHFDKYRDIDRQLNTFGCKLVVLTIEENIILERCVVSTRKWRDEKWKNYLTRIAPTEEGVADHYKKQQKEFVELCQQSEIPSMVVDASNQDWEEISFQITEFLNRS